MLNIVNLSKSYIGGKPVLKDIHLELKPGEIVGLFGRNGAGKSTLIKSILRLIPSSGKLLLDGEAISHKNITRLSFATAEHSFFARITAREHREFYELYFDGFRKDRFNLLMDFFGLKMDKQIKDFSLGQKNQFEVILALSQGADYIFLDEPFAANDIFNREDFYKLVLGILEEEETIVLATHLIEEVSNFIDRVLLLEEGRIIADRPMVDLEQQGLSLVKFIKQQLDYQGDRVSKLVEEVAERRKG